MVINKNCPCCGAYNCSAYKTDKLITRTNTMQVRAATAWLRRAEAAKQSVITAMFNDGTGSLKYRKVWNL
jgi:hypothetical protein